MQPNDRPPRLSTVPDDTIDEPDLTLIHPERLVHLLGPITSVPNSPTTRLYQAIMLAPTLTVCEALLRDEPVPVSALDPVWARRFGLTSRRAA